MNKDLSIIIMGRVFQIIVMLVSIRLLTTFLSPGEVGNYYIVLAYLAFFNLVLLNPPGMYFSRHIIQWQKSTNLFNGLVLFIGWMIVVAMISIPISIVIYYHFGYDTKFQIHLFLVYISVAIIVSTLHRNVLYGTNMLGYRKEFVIYLIMTLVLGLFFSLGIVYFYYTHALGWVFGTVIAETIMLYPIFKFFIKGNILNIQKIQLTLSKERIKKILLFTFPIAVTTFLMWGQNTAYRFIIDYRYSAETLGFIAIGLGISSAVFSSIESIAMQYLNPIFYKNIFHATKEQRSEAWNNIAKQIVPIYIISAFFTIAMSEVLISILVDKKFHDSYVYVMFGAGIEFFRVMTNLLNHVSQAEYKTTLTIKPYLVGFIVSLGLLSSIDFGTNYFMIPLVLVMAYLLVFIIMYFQMSKLLEIKINFDIKRIIFLLLPFGMIYYIPKDSSMLYNLFIITIFGSYFVLATWMIVQKMRN